MWSSKDKSNLVGPSARKPRVLVLVVCLSMLAFNTVQSQAPWPAIPGIDEGQASVHSQETFVPALALAALSYGFARWIDESERAHRVHGRIGIYGLEGYWVFNQTVGVEQQVNPWFSLSWEFLVQEWAATDSSGNKAGAGIGLIPYAKWTALSTHRLSPFVEIGTGALLNPAGQHAAARFDSTAFADFTAPTDLGFELSPAWDGIGFDWKRFDFDLGYVVTEDLTYVVSAGEMDYALTFTGFTDENGERGTPTFAYRRL